MGQDVLAAISHPARRRILRLVMDDELAVGDIAERTGIPQPATSQHLKTLREAGLVMVRIDAQRRLYRVDFDGITRLRRELDAFWTPSLQGLRDAIEDDPGS